MEKMILLLWLCSNMMLQPTLEINGTSLWSYEMSGNREIEAGEEVAIEVDVADFKESLEKKLRYIEEIIGLTSQIGILDLQYEDDTLVLDFSKEITSYGGGNESEYIIIQEILKWGFEQLNPKSITILIEGSIEGFPEGTSIQKYSKEKYKLYYEQ